MTNTPNDLQREAIITTIAASEALKPAGQRLINRIPGFEDIEESAFDPDQPWTWSACQTNTCTEDTCDGPEAHGIER